MDLVIIKAEVDKVSCLSQLIIPARLRIIAFQEYDMIINDIIGPYPRLYAYPLCGIHDRVGEGRAKTGNSVKIE